MYKNGVFSIAEFRLSGNDTVHYLEREVKYVIGSGNQTRSYICEINGYLYEMPITWYSRRKIWDLSPGYEKGNNSRFNRPIGEACLNCHVSDVNYIEGSLNRYSSVGQNIGCEKCHGAGSIHIKAMEAKEFTDTSESPDYSIVNPARLGYSLQTDICSQCHLEGIVVPVKGKRQQDYRPGLPLSDFISVLIPSGPDSSDFGFASHAERLQTSKCFIASGGKLTCITCHSSHESLSEKPLLVYNSKCMECHKSGHKICAISGKKQMAEPKGCIGCHMGKSGVTDIPHVSSTDHFIRKIVKSDLKLKTIDGNSLPVFRNFSSGHISEREKAMASLVYFETTDQNPALLAEIQKYINALDPSSKVKYAYLSNNAGLLGPLRESAENQTDAYTAFYYSGLKALSPVGVRASLPFLQRAVVLAPENLLFRTRLGDAFDELNNPSAALNEYLQVLKLNPFEEKALVNAGWCCLEMGRFDEALVYTQRAVVQNPYNKSALENRVNILMQKKEFRLAEKWLLQLIQQYPYDANYRQMRVEIHKLK
ncbi:MAG: tetratricopeptide repeat protein [Bacteroidota bacterium]